MGNNSFLIFYKRPRPLMLLCVQLSQRESPWQNHKLCQRVSADGEGEPVFLFAQSLLDDGADSSQSFVDLGLILQAGHCKVRLAAALAAGNGSDLLGTEKNRCVWYMTL